jgi:hypothetical protein
MKTVAASALTPDDLAAAICTVTTGGQCTIYYAGDTLPNVPVNQTALDAQTTATAKLATDSAAANAYAKLVALKTMTPAQVQAWVAANVTNLVQAQDAIATLAIAVSILSRRL